MSSIRSKKRKKKKKREEEAKRKTIGVFWLNIAENRVYLWYRYCSKLFDKLRREANFSNGVIEILTKKDKRGERNDVIVGVRKELNFGNEVIEIPSIRILLPRSMKCSKEMCSKGEKKKPIMAIKLPKFKGREEREKRIMATKLLKMGWKKKEKKNSD